MDFQVKLIDFGNSRELVTEDFSNVTKLYDFDEYAFAAPDFEDPAYTRSLDTWNLGVTAYCLYTECEFMFQN